MSIYVVEPIIFPYRLLTSPWPSVRQGYFLIFRILVFIFFISTLIVSLYRSTDRIEKWPFFLTHIGFVLATLYFGIVSVEMFLASRLIQNNSEKNQDPAIEMYEGKKRGFLDYCDSSVEYLKSTFREKELGGNRSKLYLFSLWQLCIMNIPMHVIIFIMFWGTLATNRISRKWENDDLTVYADISMHGVELVLLMIDFCLMKRIPVRFRHGIFIIFFGLLYIGWMCLGYYINHSAGSTNPWCYKILALDGPTDELLKNYGILGVVILAAFLSFFALTLNHSDKENHVIPAKKLLSRIIVVSSGKKEPPSKGVDIKLSRLS